MAETKLQAQAQELHQVITELVKKFQFRNRNQVCCHGISVSQCYALEAISECGQASMGSLAAQLHVTVSTITRVVDQLVTKQLVERRVGPEDRRVCCVTLTPSGRDLVNRIRDQLLTTEVGILRKIHISERSNLLWALRELSQAVDDWREMELVAVRSAERTPRSDSGRNKEAQ